MLADFQQKPCNVNNFNNIRLLSLNFYTHVMRKLAFCICENKEADQLHSLFLLHV